MTALPREFAVLRRWTSRHSRWWISAVRKLRSSHGCGGLVLRVFFLFWRVCEGSFKLPRLFLSDELPLNEAFFLIWVSEEKSEWGHFSGKNRNERQPDNLSGIENKDKSKARLSPGSRIVHVKKHVIWQSLLSPHFMRTETAGWTERTKRYKAWDSWIWILETTRKMGQNEYYDKVY